MQGLLFRIVYQRPVTALDEIEFEISFVWRVFDDSNSVKDTEHAEKRRLGGFARPPGGPNSRMTFLFAGVCRALQDKAGKPGNS